MVGTGYLRDGCRWGESTDLPTMTSMTGIRHGHPTVNALPSVPEGMGITYEIYVMDAGDGNESAKTH